MSTQSIFSAKSGQLGWCRTAPQVRVCVCGHRTVVELLIRTEKFLSKRHQGAIYLTQVHVLETSKSVGTSLKILSCFPGLSARHNDSLETNEVARLLQHYGCFYVSVYTGASNENSPHTRWTRKTRQWTTKKQTRCVSAARTENGITTLLTYALRHARLDLYVEYTDYTVTCSVFWWMSMGWKKQAVNIQTSVSFQFCISEASSIPHLSPSALPCFLSNNSCRYHSVICLPEQRGNWVKSTLKRNSMIWIQVKHGGVAMTEKQLVDISIN